MVLSTFDQENHDRILKEHSEKIGFNHGKKQGKLESIIAITKKKLEKQMPVKVIADFMEEPEETIQRIADTIQAHPEADLDALCQLLHPSDEMKKQNARYFDTIRTSNIFYLSETGIFPENNTIFAKYHRKAIIDISRFSS